MSIDARIWGVGRDPNGFGQLNLMDRPARPRGTPGCAGQFTLYFEASPDCVTDLIGCDIWGGSNSIMLGDVEIARRDGYTGLVFHDGLAAAIADYRRDTGRDAAPKVT